MHPPKAFFLLINFFPYLEMPSSCCCVGGTWCDDLGPHQSTIVSWRRDFSTSLSYIPQQKIFIIASTVLHSATLCCVRPKMMKMLLKKNLSAWFSQRRSELSTFGFPYAVYWTLFSPNLPKWHIWGPAKLIPKFILVIFTDHGWLVLPETLLVITQLINQPLCLQR